INRTVSFSERNPTFRKSDRLSNSRQYFLSRSSRRREPVKINPSRSLLSISPARKVNNSFDSLPSSTLPSRSSYSSINTSSVRSPIESRTSSRKSRKIGYGLRPSN